MQPASINIYRLSMGVLYSLVLPMFAAILLDWNFGTLPLLTSIASIIVIPIASIIVIKSVLAEFERVIQEVAPQVPENNQENAQA